MRCTITSTTSPLPSRVAVRSEGVDGVTEVHTFARQVASTRLRVDFQPGLLVHLPDSVGVVRRRGRGVADDLPVLGETEVAFGVMFDVPRAFVDGPVMVAAQQHEVGGGGFAAPGPVLDVVGVEAELVGAAGEAAAMVS